MSDRLSDLRRQRALAQEQLAWLDREIAREVASATPGPAAGVSHPVPPAVPATRLESPAPAATSDPNAIIEEYRVPADTLQRDVRKGCFLYFALAFVALGLFLLALYLLIGRR